LYYQSSLYKGKKDVSLVDVFEIEMETDKKKEPNNNTTSPDQAEKKKEKKNLKLPKDDFPGVFPSQEEKDKAVSHLPYVKIKKNEEKSPRLQHNLRTV